MKLKTQIQLCFHSISRAREPQKPTEKKKSLKTEKIVSRVELVDFHISNTKHVVLAVSCKSLSIYLLTLKVFTLLISIFHEGSWTAHIGVGPDVGKIVKASCWGGEIESQGFKSNGTRKDEIEKHEKETRHSGCVSRCWGEIR